MAYRQERIPLIGRTATKPDIDSNHDRGIGMSARQYILVVDDDPLVTDALAVMLDRPGRTIVCCSDIESAEICLTQYPVTHLVSDVQFSGDFGFEGLHFLNRVREIAPGCRIVLITGYATDALRKAAIELGAAGVLCKPFDTNELEHALSTGPAPGEDSASEIIRFPSMKDILGGDALRTVFQPIVRTSAEDGPAFGFEALARASGNWLSGGPAMLFEYADKRSCLIDLNVKVLTSSIMAAKELPGSPAIFVNVDPLAFGTRRLVTALKAACSAARLPLSRLVLEVTERSAFVDEHAAARVFDELRDEGTLFALDDHGSAFSHLSSISRIRPSFIKISQTFGTDFERDPARTSIIRNVVALARDFGCETILEGIECAETARAAVHLGVDLLQGYYFGRPALATQWASPASVRAA